eukprot:scaffold2898_cov68-Phaeocystis_antarctica.AAC.4
MQPLARSEAAPPRLLGRRRLHRRVSACVPRGERHARRRPRRLTLGQAVRLAEGGQRGGGAARLEQQLAQHAPGWIGVQAGHLGFQAADSVSTHTWPRRRPRASPLPCARRLRSTATIVCGGQSVDLRSSAAALHVHACGSSRSVS